MTDSDNTSIMVTKSTSLSMFANNDWFKSPKKSLYWLRIYTLIGIKRENLNNLIKNAIGHLHYNLPIQIKYGYLEEFDFPCWRQHLTNNENGKYRISLEQIKETFPGSSCVFISMPFINDGVCIGSEKVTSALSIIPSLIISHVGKNILRDIVFDGVVSCDDGKFKKSGTVTNIPKPHDGPTSQKFIWQSIQDTVMAIEKAPSDKKIRIEMAFDIFNKGLNEYSQDQRKSDAFIFYWIAMEVLAGGEGKIEASLQNHYRMKSREEVRKVLGTKTIRDWRNNMIHDGHRPPVTPHIERYMQLIFIDILRSHLGLKLISLAYTFGTSDGVDLSPIGLANNIKRAYSINEHSDHPD